MKSWYSDKDFVASIRARMGDLRQRRSSEARDLAEVALAYGRLEERLDKIIRISDRYQGQLREESLRMEYIARTDPLTGLANRRDTMERLQKELARFRRYGTPFSVILFDLDDFKSVNDSFGHNVGDAALRTVAQVFGAELRDTDSCGRWGGEEFLVLCPETQAEDALIVAEKCKKVLAGTAIECKDCELHLTMSGGVCSAVSDIDLDNLVKRADDALYRAKAEGKDSVYVWK